MLSRYDCGRSLLGGSKPTSSRMNAGGPPDHEEFDHPAIVAGGLGQSSLSGFAAEHPHPQPWLGQRVLRANADELPRLHVELEPGGPSARIYAKVICVPGRAAAPRYGNRGSGIPLPVPNSGLRRARGLVASQSPEDPPQPFQNRTASAAYIAALRRRISSVSGSRTSCKSPTRPNVAKLKMGASGSLLIATITSDVCIPALCWIDPEMPQAM